MMEVAKNEYCICDHKSLPSLIQAAKIYMSGCDRGIDKLLISTHNECGLQQQYFVVMPCYIGKL
jgi:hypothetical protein